MATKRKTEGTAADRLTQALQTLTRRRDGGEPEKVTVAELCRHAGVSRNALYRFHPEVLQSLRQYQRACERAGESNVSGKNQKLSSENASLRKKLTTLAALVDHYYLAHREVRGLLERRERELADLRRSLKARPIALAR
jgi:AcrR family transcriptional regulator